MGFDTLYFAIEIHRKFSDGARIYRDTVEQSYHRYQDYPLIAPLFYLIRARWATEAKVNSRRPLPEFQPEYIDDAFSGGDVMDALEASIRN